MTEERRKLVEDYEQSRRDLSKAILQEVDADSALRAYDAEHPEEVLDD